MTDYSTACVPINVLQDPAFIRRLLDPTLVAGVGRMRISTAEFVRRFGRWYDEALAQPAIITRDGRGRLILMSLAMYPAPTAPLAPYRVAPFIRTFYPNIIPRLSYETATPMKGLSYD